MRHTSWRAGIACAAACDDCVHLIGNPEPNPDSGIRMVIIHACHVPELQAEGWILTAGRDGDLPDITCIHYHLKHWEGGHADDCCGMGPGI